MGWKIHINVRQIQPGKVCAVLPPVFYFFILRKLCCAPSQQMSCHASILQHAEVPGKLLSLTGFNYSIRNDESSSNCCDHVNWTSASGFHPVQVSLELIYFRRRGRGRNCNFESLITKGPTTTFILLLPSVLRIHIRFEMWSYPSQGSTMGFYFSLTCSIKGLINKVRFPKQLCPGAKADLSFSLIRKIDATSKFPEPAISD